MYSPTAPDEAKLALVTPLIVGVVIVGDVAKTLTPVPVLSVRAEERLAEEGVPKKVATPAPRPETPVEIGRPVTFVIVPEAGVPRAGVTRIGLTRVVPDPIVGVLSTALVRVGPLEKTRLPVPVSSVTMLARLADVGVVRNVLTPAAMPVTLPTGRPVQLERLPDVGVPSAGVTKVGEVCLTVLPVPVMVSQLTW
jgi:hypothetical protein